jgi:hypothetical protein
MAQAYPEMNLLQLGLACFTLGALRSILGHEGARGTVRDYIHPLHLTADTRQCIDFLEREILAIKKSKVDVDFTKYGNGGSFRRDADKKQL